MTDSQIDVLIAGAGPVGLATAIELGHRNISCMVVERNDRVGHSPRAKTTNVRTREHLRRWGIAEDLRAASPMSPDYPSTIIFATRMNGPELARFENALNGTRKRNNLYSEEAQWVPQYVLEEVLRKHASSLRGVTLAFNTELMSFVESHDGVAAVLKDLVSGESRDLNVRYLVGADGARSKVREGIGATMQGDRGTFRNYNTIFRAPMLAARQAHGPAIMYWMVNDDVPSVLSPLDENGLWSFIATKLANNVDPATLDPVDLIRRSSGLSDLKIEVVANFPWTAQQLIADRYATSRVMLAGDACHLHPPFGGFGMNMGIGDAVDLGWKIAATLQGWGGPALLPSYAQERRAVHERTIAEAVHNYGAVGNQLVRPGLEAVGSAGDATRNEVSELILATKIREFKTLGVVLGSRYESPLIVPDEGSPPPEDPTLYVPSAYPGCLAPHLWLDDGSSLYDHFGPGFTLLVTSEPRADAAPMIAAAENLNVPFRVILPPDPRLRARYQARFALIRPDQHVAWRGEKLPADCSALLARVCGTLTVPASDATPVAEDTESVIRHLEEERIRALISKDWQTLKSLLSDHLVHVHANGAVENKDTYLETMATQFEILKVDRPSLHIRVFGETAVVTGPLNQLIRITRTGDTVEMHAIATQIWVKQQDAWTQCGFQATRVS